MRTSDLKILLSRLDQVDDPDPELEQYQTPPDIAADVLNTARISGDLDGDMVDLGCGNGIFALGAALLDATARGYDVDSTAVQTARSNHALLEDETGRELDATFHEAEVRSVDDTADTVIMNPPFGIQRENENVAFLTAAFGIADTVYALLHQSTEKRGQTRRFIADRADDHGYEAAIIDTYRFPLPRQYRFHDKETRHVPVDLYKFSHPTEG